MKKKFLDMNEESNRDQDIYFKNYKNQLDEYKQYVNENSKYSWT